MATKAGKRPLRSLTAHEKLDAIRRVHDGESKASVARDIGVPESTLRGWCKNEDKISYLSRQSSPETDESVEHKDKRAKIDDSIMQPFNLSLKQASTNSFDYLKNDHNLSAKAETPKSAAAAHNNISERERNRAELARLSIELGLNRPEMFMPNMATTNASSNLADLTANIGLLAQWNSLLMQKTQQQQQQQMNPTKKVTAAAADTSTNMVSSSAAGLLTTVIEAEKQLNKPPKSEKQSVHDSVWYWLKTQQAMLGLNQQQQQQQQNAAACALSNALSTSAATPISSTAAAALNGDQSSWFWKWYKQFAYNQAAQIPQTDNANKPILYQQLTKDKEEQLLQQQHNAENLSLAQNVDETSPKIHTHYNNNNKARSVLDNLLFNNNNNNVSVNKRGDEDDEDVLSQSEALGHGEKFLKWLEACSDPSVTAMQIMQFRSLLNNVKTGADRKNGDLQNKAKVKRK